MRLKDSKELKGDLVVDASGRTSAAQRWLVQAGYTEPRVVSVDAGLGYATRLYQVPRELMQVMAPWKGSACHVWMCAMRQAGK